ncbi:MAG: hypothetical protein AAGG65_21940, partial [Pseudomonadota bacterium]
MIKHQTLRSQLALSTAMAAVLLVASHVDNSALAGSCTGSAGVFTCSGPASPTGTDAPQILDGGAGPVTVTTEAGFGLDTTMGSAGPALRLLGTGGVTFDDANPDGSDITVSKGGIYAFNNGSGDVSITAYGAISTASGAGVKAYNFAADGALTISTNDVRADNLFAIYAVGGGTGGMSVTTTGETEILTPSRVGAVIWAQNGGGGSLEISADKAILGSYASTAILAENNNTDTTDLIISIADFTSGYGIAARNSGTGDLTISASGPLTAGRGYAIEATNRTSGSIEITTEDTVTARSGPAFDGVAFDVTNTSGTDSITISTADIVADTAAIIATNDGTGDIRIAASGDVQGAVLATNRSGGVIDIDLEGTVSFLPGNGISATNESGDGGISVASAGVQAGGYGIVVEDSTTGDIEITTTGAVSAGTADGINAENTTGGSIAIDAGFAVTSDEAVGIRATNFADTDSVTISAADVAGGYGGIAAVNYGMGALSIEASGTVSGGRYFGVAAINTGAELTISAADIDSGGYGIVASQRGDGALS